MSDSTPAFPRAYSYNEAIPGRNRPEHAQSGMTLRQYYAGLAMQGIIASRIQEDGSPGITCQWADTPSVLAELAFWTADAMLAHEKKEQE